MCKLNHLIAMKKYLHVIALFVTVTAFAQDFQGIAEYESKTSFDLSVSEDGQAVPEMDEQLKIDLAKAFEKKYILRFDKTASLYEEQEKLAAPSPGGHMLEVKTPGDGKHYKNLKQKNYIVETDAFDKDFLIVDSLPKHDWQMTGETKKIGNYTCYKATAVLKPEVPEAPKEEKAVSILGTIDSETTITAWYTPDIPVSHGPANYWGLPGLILEVSDGRTVLLCSKVVINPKEKIEIKAPKKGERVTQSEFNQIMEKKSQEMMEMYEGDSSGGTMIIKIGG